MKRLIRFLDELLAPRGVKCLCCDEASEGKYLCSDCSNSLKALRLPHEEATHGDVYSAYRYDGAAKQLVVSLKEECLADAAQVLADGMYEALHDLHLPPETVMTWVTMPEKRRIQRGIDHGYELCRALSERCGFPVQKLLSRRGKVHTQRGLSREKRLKNLQGTFLCDIPLNVPVVLVDDVLTTGSTASACEEALLKAGATRVYVITATKATLAEERMDMRKVDRYGLFTS